MGRNSANSRRKDVSDVSRVPGEHSCVILSGSTLSVRRVLLTENESYTMKSCYSLAQKLSGLRKVLLAELKTDFLPCPLRSVTKYHRLPL